MSSAETEQGRECEKQIMLMAERNTTTTLSMFTSNYTATTLSRQACSHMHDPSVFT